jgi:hypothetical protein
MTQEHDDLLERLSGPFDGYFTAEGVQGPFLSGEQIAKRLNQVMGPGGWYFRVVETKHAPEADEVMTLGEMALWIGGQWVVRQQWGGQKVKRSRQSGNPTNLSDDHKGAATDSMKKCASLFGVGLYMMVSQAQWHQGVPDRQAAAAARQNATQPRPAPSRPVSQPAAPKASQTRPMQPTEVSDAQRTGPYPAQRYDSDGTTVACCQTCGNQLQPVTMGGVKWTVNKLAYQGRRYHGMVLCGDDYLRAEALARESRKAAG